MEKIFKKLCLILSVVLVISSCSFAVICIVPDNGKSLADKFDILRVNDIANNKKNLEINMTSTIYVQNKKGDWEEYQRIHGSENRIWTTIDKVSPQLIDAIISIEDERFESHKGIDWKRTFAATANLVFKFYSSNQGGSTITQQLIKNITNDNKQNAFRKVREIGRALLLETKLEKTEIMEAYLNTIALGNGICGVQVAANYYFNKNPNELTLTECAALAGITKNPSLYSPDKNPEKNKERRDIVLKKMYELKKITEEEYINALNTEIKIDKSQQNEYEAEVNNYFVDALLTNIIEDLAEEYDYTTEIASRMVYNGGYKIYATINTDIQNTMENVYSSLNKYFPQKSSKDKDTRVQSAMTIMDYQGHIIGIVGGVGEKTVNRGLNRAYDSPRQPGSTMKPIGVYAPAIDSNLINYSTMVNDKPIDGYFADGKKGPKEWFGYYMNNVTVQYAIEKSMNVIPCKVLQDLGVDASYDFLTKKIGAKHLTQIDKNLASLALGGCQYGITTTESAAAYAIFGNGGLYYKPTTYYKVTNASDQIVLEPKKPKQAVSSETATIMNRLLQKVVYGRNGTAGGISGYNSMTAYAKTGTTNDSKDLWMVAASPYYVGSVWYGFDQPEDLKNPGAASAVWKAVMSSVHKGLKSQEFQYSENVVTAKYCTSTGYLAGSYCGTATGYYNKDAMPEKCTGKHGNTGNKTSSANTSVASSEPQDSSSVPSSSGESSSSKPNEGSSSGSSSSGSSDNSTSSASSTPSTPPPPSSSENPQ